MAADSLPRYLAARLASVADLPPRADSPTLRAALWETRGIPVLWAPGLRRAGWCVEEPDVGILLRPGAGLRVLSHEAGHAVLAVNLGAGIEYPAWEWEGLDREQFAEQFAAALEG